MIEASKFVRERHVEAFLNYVKWTNIVYALQDKEKIFLAKYFCVRLHAAMGAALTLGFFVASRMRVVL